MAILVFLIIGVFITSWNFGTIISVDDIRGGYNIMQIKFNIETGEILGYAIIGSLGSDSDDDIMRVKQPDDLNNFEESYEVVNGTLKLKSERDIYNAKSDKELSMIRSERDKLLVASDWRMVNDYPHSDQGAWKRYREDLRDLPSAYNNPTRRFEWPVKP